MNYLPHFERLLQVNRRLHALDLPVVCTCGHIPNMGLFILLKHTTTDTIKHLELTDSIESVIEQAKLLFEPKFTQVTKACVDLLTTELWLDKQTLVTVQSISADGIQLTDGSIVESNRLFIKE